MKVACEQLVRDGAASWTVIRPGLIVGPDDPTGRFTYWPVRLAEGGEAMAGGRPEDEMQVIDARDLAAWIVSCAESRTAGDYDGVGEVMPVGDLIARVADGVGSDATLTWVAAGVPHRAGRRAVGGPGLAAAVAAAPRVRRARQPRPGPVARRRPDAAPDRGHRPRHPRVAARDAGRDRQRNVARRGGRGPRGVARSLGSRWSSVVEAPLHGRCGPSRVAAPRIPEPSRVGDLRQRSAGARDHLAHDTEPDGDAGGDGPVRGYAGDSGQPGVVERRELVARRAPVLRPARTMWATAWPRS